MHFRQLSIRELDLILYMYIYFYIYKTTAHAQTGLSCHTVAGHLSKDDCLDATMSGLVHSCCL